MEERLVSADTTVVIWDNVNTVVITRSSPCIFLLDTGAIHRSTETLSFRESSKVDLETF